MCCTACRESREIAATVVEGPVAPEPAPTAPRRFEIIRPIGHGGMGVVYEAIDRELGCRVALKQLREPRPELLCRFKNEFRSLEGIHHPNCVRPFELIEEGNDWFMTMELVDGVDLLTWVRDEDRGLDERRLRLALGQLVHALIALHEAGMVHRDVKPANVLVTSSGRVVLIDFGLVASASCGEGESVGTPAYVAPEQMAAQPPDPASDWYSLGAVLYQALTGSLPFGNTLTTILNRKPVEDPVRPSELAAGVPEDLERLCVALMARDPSARPDGRELLARLRKDPAPRGLARVARRLGRAWAELRTRRLAA